MKKVVLILIMVPALVFAQKPVKPNLNKALNAWKSGKLQEAKEMIDLCVTDPKLSTQGNTYYYKGLIYASLDTTSNETFKKLAENPLQTSAEAFAKADQMGGDKGYYINDENGFPTILKHKQIEVLNNYYLNKGITAYQEDDHETSLKYFEKSQVIMPNDTSGYYFGAIVTQNLELWDKAISNINSFYEKGGKASDAYGWLVNIYNVNKSDKNKALEVVRVAKAKYPTNPEFAKYEIGLLIDLDRIDEARTGLEKAVKDDPTNKTFHFFLGYTYLRQKNNELAKKSFEEALKLDPNYFEAQFYLASVISEEPKKIKKEMRDLGISAADKKKKFELDAVYVKKLKESLPYWEKAEKLKSDDRETLYELYTIYQDLDMQAQLQRIEKRLKELGYE